MKTLTFALFVLGIFILVESKNPFPLIIQKNSKQICAKWPRISNIRRATANQRSFRNLKQIDTTDDNNLFTPTSYVVIQTFVRSILDHCLDGEILDFECLHRVSKDISLSTAVTEIISQFPVFKQVFQFQYIDQACYNRDERECVIAISKLAASIYTSTASQSICMGYLCPFVDGFAQHYVSKGIDFIAKDTTVGVCGVDWIATRLTELKSVPLMQLVGSLRESVERNVNTAMQPSFRFIKDIASMYSC
jgi:hypothetical protein